MHEVAVQQQHLDERRGATGVAMSLGAVAGLSARLLVPGRDDLSVVQTVVLGTVRSFVGGFLGYLLFHKDSSGGFVRPSSWIGSVVGAVIALLVFNAVTGREAHHRTGALS